MGITVGAALKKVAAAILTEPKVLKNILFAILVVVVALLLPVVMVVCLFSGRFQVDTAELQRYVEANLTAADVQLLQDWKESLERIHLAVRECSDAEAVCAAVYRELTAFYMRYADLFHAAETVIPAPPRKYHVILRDQLAQVFRPLCENDFTADFLAEAMLTWTVAGIPFDQLYGLMRKIIAQ